MLVLSRTELNPDGDERKSQVVLKCACGGRIVVTVVKTDCGGAKLGFEAPKTVEILRAELEMGRESEGSE